MAIRFRPGRRLTCIERGWTSQYECPDCGHVGMAFEGCDDMEGQREHVRCRGCGKRFVLHFKKP